MHCRGTWARHALPARQPYRAGLHLFLLLGLQLVCCGTNYVLEMLVTLPECLQLG